MKDRRILRTLTLNIETIAHLRRAHPAALGRARGLAGETRDPHDCQKTQITLQL